MNSFAQPGLVMDLVAPYARTSGQGMLVGNVFGVVTNDVALSASVPTMLEGAFNLAKTSAQAWAQGDKLYWDDTNKRLDNTNVGPLVGVATAAAANPSALGPIRLMGPPVIRAQAVSADGTSAPQSYATVGAQVYTAADLVGGIIVRDTNGASRTDTLPTAALIVAAVPGAKVGDVIKTLIVNGADAAEVLTLQAGAGGAFDANQTAASRVIGQNVSKTLYTRLTNVTGGAEACVHYL